MDAAFAGAKQVLLSATHLAQPTVGAELSVVVDALATHVGAFLQQQLPCKKDWQPLSFFSKKLEAAQQKYTACYSLFACYSDINHFRYMLDYCRFAIFSLTTSPSPMPWSGCPIHGRHTSPGSCPMWQSTRWTFDTSPGQPMWWRTLSPGQPVMWRWGGLPRWRPV
jgi:hypothetical protein